ncbi:MAG: hypothetical protein KC635_10855 [Myxococcales bacterium]|nr:hypothetical protein [Myxococcales bacterium]
MRAPIARTAALAALSLTLFACKSAPEPAPEPTPPTPEEASGPPVAAKPTPAPLCAPPGATLEQPRLDGDGVFFCTYASDPDAEGNYSRCFRFDLATSALAARPVPKVAEPADAQDAPPTVDGEGWRYDRGAQAVFLCSAPGECKKKLDLGSKKLAPLEYGTADTSASGKLVLVNAAERDAGENVWVIVFDRATGKRVAKKKVSFDSYICGGARFVGETVLVGLDVCAGPGGAAWLAKPTTLAKLAELGGKDDAFNTYAPLGVPIGDGLWAFRSSGLGSVVVQDVTTGKVVRKVDLSELFPLIPDYDPPARDLPPDGGFFGQLPSGELVAVPDGTGFGHVAVLDAKATRVVRRLEIPVCPEGK